MDDMYDLREYVRLVWRWRWVVLGAGLVAAAAALITSSLQPATYEATALVAVAAPRYTLQFDPRIETNGIATPPYAAYRQLATSDELLQALLAQLDPRPKDVGTLDDLRGMLEAKAGSDPSLVQLTVRSQSPEGAARVANAWATELVVRANDLYGQANAEQVGFFEGQAQDAKAQLDEAVQALVDFQARNEGPVLQARLTALNTDLENRLAEKDGVAATIRRVQALEAHINSQPASEHAALADEVTALLLQTSSLGGSEPVIQLAPSGEVLPAASQSTAELSAFLDGLANTLEGQGERIDARVAELQPQILTVQKQLEEVNAETARLTQERDLAQQTYTSLANKVEETRIAAQDSSSQVRLASLAAVPQKAAGRGRMMITALAACAGLALGMLAAFAVEWWKAEPAVAA